MGTFKAFADGGGLCSPGRWAPGDRKTEDYGLNGLREILLRHFREAVVDERGKQTSPMDIVLRLVSVRFDSNPFKEEMLNRARLEVARWLGSGEEILGVPPGQEFRLDLIAGLPSGKKTVLVKFRERPETAANSPNSGTKTVVEAKTSPATIPTSSA